MVSLLLSFFSFFFCLFRAEPMTYGGFPGQRSNQSYSCWPTPQPQECQIWATSMTYTTAHHNARSLTHWAGPGIGPESSWMLLGFITNEPRWELSPCCILNFGLPSLYILWSVCGLYVQYFSPCLPGEKLCGRHLVPGWNDWAAFVEVGSSCGPSCRVSWSAGAVGRRAILFVLCLEIW